jgi:hypothetical protein
MNQSSLPIKTKIVAWIMILIGAICSISLLFFLIFSISIKMTHSYALQESHLFAGLLMALLTPIIYLISPSLLGNQSESFLLFLPYFLIAVLFIISGFILLKEKKWAWWVSLFFLIIEVFFVTYQLILTYPGENAFICSNPSLYISGILIILLILDKNNYLKQLAKS